MIIHFFTIPSITQFTDYLIRSVSLDDTSMSKSSQVNPSVLLIVFDWTFWNGLCPSLVGKLTFWRFGISKYYHVQYSEILSNVSERGFSKFLPPELVMDVRFGRSTFIHFESTYYYFALSTNMMNHYIFHVVQHNQVLWIVMMEDLFKSFHSNSFNTFDYCW